MRRNLVLRIWKQPPREGRLRNKRCRRTVTFLQRAIGHLLLRDSRWHGFARGAVGTASATAEVTINHLVLAELMATPFPERTAIGIGMAIPSCATERRNRRAILAKFLIGAHAAIPGFAIITGDARRFAGYFPELTLITPETHP